MLCGQGCLQINLLPIIDKWSSGICIYLPDLSPMHWMGCPALRWPLQESGMSTIHMHLKTLKHKGQDLHDRFSTPNRTVAEEPMWDRKKWESLMSGPIQVSNRFLLYLDFWFSIKCWDIDGPKFKHTNIAAIIIQRYHWRAIPTDHLHWNNSTTAGVKTNHSVLLRLTATSRNKKIMEPNCCLIVIV